MIRILLIQLLFTVFIFTTRLSGQCMNEKLSKLFFNTDVTQLNNSLLSKFLLNTSLHKTSETIDTVFYPSRNENVKYFIQHNFVFNENHFIKARFTDGNLGVISGKDNQNKDFTTLFLAIEFVDSTTLNNAYNEMISQFKFPGKPHSESTSLDSITITDDICKKKIEIFIFQYAMKLKRYILYVYLKNSID